MVVVFTTLGIIRLRSTYPKIVPDFFYGAGRNFGGVVDLDRDVGHHRGASGFSHERVGALKVALLALKVSKMSKNDHKREKIVNTHKIKLNKLGFWANLTVRG